MILNIKNIYRKEFLNYTHQYQKYLKIKELILQLLLQQPYFVKFTLKFQINYQKKCYQLFQLFFLILIFFIWLILFIFFSQLQLHLPIFFFLFILLIFSFPFNKNLYVIIYSHQNSELLNLYYKSYYEYKFTIQLFFDILFRN